MSRGAHACGLGGDMEETGHGADMDSEPQGSTGEQFLSGNSCCCCHGQSSEHWLETARPVRQSGTVCPRLESCPMDDMWVGQTGSNTAKAMGSLALSSNVMPSLMGE